MQKRYLPLFVFALVVGSLVIFSPGKANATSSLGAFSGSYTCFQGGTTLSQTGLSLTEGDKIVWKCPNGTTNVNFKFRDSIWYGDKSTIGSRFIFSMTPSYPIGVNRGQSTGIDSDICMVSQSKIICPVLVSDSFTFGFALFIDGNQSDYWHVLDVFQYASESDKSALGNYQAQYGINNNIQNGINDIKDGQQGTTDAIKDQTEESKKQHEEKKGWFASIIDGIVNLPGKIVTFLIDGLKDLFVPSGDEMNQLINDLKTSMEDKLGFIGETLTIVVDLFQSIITSTDTSTCLNFPAINVMGHSIFDGACVEFVPEGFEDIAETVRLFIDVICTITFINMARNKIDQFLAGRSDQL